MEKNFGITNPRYSKHIFPVPWPLVKSRFRLCIEVFSHTFYYFQGHPTDRLGKFSVRKASNPLRSSFLRELSPRAFVIREKFNARSFRIVRLGTEKRSAIIFGKTIRPKVFGKSTKKTSHMCSIGLFNVHMKSHRKQTRTKDSCKETVVKAKRTRFVILARDLDSSEILTKNCTCDLDIKIELEILTEG